MPSELFFNMYSLVSHFGVFTLKFLLIKIVNFGKIYTYNICYLNHFKVYSSVTLTIFTLLHSQYLELFFNLTKIKLDPLNKNLSPLPPLSPW